MKFEYLILICLFLITEFLNENLFQTLLELLTVEFKYILMLNIW